MQTHELVQGTPQWDLPTWRSAIESGKTTAAAVIAKVQTKAPLSKQQQAQIHGQ